MAISASGYNTTRINGMFSGLDTEALVTNMLSAQQAKYDKLFQQKEKAQWKYDAYTSLNTSVSSLRNSYLSVLGEKSVMSSSTYNRFKVNMQSNAALKITGTASADATSFTVTSTTMAKAASVSYSINSQQTEVNSGSAMFKQAQASGKLASGVTAGATLFSLAEEFGVGEDGKLSFSINGETFTYDLSENGKDVNVTVGQMIEDINESEKANATATIGSDGSSISIVSDKVGSGSALTLSNIKGKVFSDGETEGMLGINKGSAGLVSVVDVNKDTFASLAKKLGVTVGTGTTFSINGKEFSLYGLEVDAQGNPTEELTIQQVMDKVNESDAGVKMSFENGAFSIRSTSGAGPIELEGELFESGAIGMEEGTHSDVSAVRRSDTLAEAARKMGAAIGDTLEVKINGKAFSFDTSKTTLSSMMDTINKDEAVGATFTFSEMTDSFSVTSDETGASSKLEISGFEVFGLESKEYNNGKNAELTFTKDGVSHTISQASNSFTLDGLRFEITADETFENGGMAVSVEQDYQATIDKVKAFVEDYNKLIEELNGKYYEDTYRDYAPLTEEQRSALTEKEAELWDAKAKSGVLKNDSAISSLLTNLRSSLYVKVGDTGMSAFNLGISTVSWSSGNWKTEQGKLQLDEDKLLAALQKNPDAVADVLTKIDTSSNGTSVSGSGASAKSESGLFVRMNSILANFNSTMRATNLTNTQKSINDYSERMSEMLDKMSEMEENYYAKFAALETALSELQSQSSYFSGMLGTNSNNS